MLNLTFLGHSAFLLEAGGVTLALDPFLTGNPLAAGLDTAGLRVNYVLLTHVHGDHLGDTIALASRCKAPVVCNFEVGCYLQTKGIEVVTMHIGGAKLFPFGRIKLTQALHGNSLIENGKVLSLGNPNGFVVNLGGKNVYHAGDTGLFSDMKLIGEIYKPDIAFLPIGDHFTMDPLQAAKAVELLGVKQVVPMHYGTFPLLTGTPDRLESLVAPLGVEVLTLKPGETAG